MRARLKEIAEKTGYGVSTVALVLQKRGDRLGIKKSTQAKIKKTASALGYKPDFIASSLRTGKTNVVAVVGSAYRFQIREMRQHAAAQILKEKGYRAHLFDFYWEGGRALKLLQEIEDLRPEGILLAETRGRELLQYLERLKNRGIPMVGLDHIDGLNIDLVYIDREMASYLQARHLLSLGHKKIVYTTPRESADWSMQKRMQGFKKALDEAGIPVTEKNFVWPRNDGNPYQIGYEISKDGFSEKSKCTGLMALNDQVAIGLMRGFFERKVRIPEELSIVGAENLPESMYCAVPLTTVTFPVDRVAKTAVRLLMERIGGEKKKPEIVKIEPYLTVRNSCQAIGEKMGGGS